MQELLALIVLFLAIIVVVVGFSMNKATPTQTTAPSIPVVQPVSTTQPIYFPRPIYPYPRMLYPIRPFPSYNRPPYIRR